MKSSGFLYIVATPIGNLGDITLRALETLKGVDFICAEDTRHSKILLDKYEIRTPLLSFHAHSGDFKLEKIIARIKGGDSAALVSDAGTPGISDPGYNLVREAMENNIQVVPVPGPSALITALSASGLPTDKFVYLGFLPVKKGRQTLFKTLRDEEKTVVFYESPHRLEKTMGQMLEILGPERQIVLASELTKIHECFWRGSLGEVLAWLSKNKPRGEYTVLVRGSVFEDRG